MITRAQAEALLTLAESLEACERLGVELSVPGRWEMSLWISGDAFNLDLNEQSELSGKVVRLAVSDLAPKSEI